MKRYKFRLPEEGHIIFSVYELDDGGVQITGTRAYDWTDYHWASKPAGAEHWRIIRKGKVVSTLKSTRPLTGEEIARHLLDADEKAHLKPVTAIW